MIVSIFAGLLAAAPVSGAPTSDAQEMAAMVAGFYTVHAHTDQDGIPDAKTRARYAPYVSPALLKLLADGDAAENAYAKANKDSPPLVEGDLFSPNFEGITSFKVEGCAAKGGSGHCALKAHYADAHPRPQDKPVDWTDTVSLVRTPQGWRVDDIAYGGNWDFGNHGTLSGVLKSSIADAKGAP